MNPLFAETGRARRLSGFGLALAAALALTSAAPAADGVYQATDAADQITYYTNLNTVRIPFGEVDRRYVEVALYVSTKFGQSYQKVATANPGDREFRFQAPGDGWYWFTVQTRDTEGRFSPPDMSLAQPQIKMCVDTHPPAISNFRWLQPQNGQVGVEWEVGDMNLDPTSLRVDYRPVNGDWIPLPVKQAATGQYYWNPGTNAPIEARIQVQDKAHNPAEYKTPPSGGGGFRVGSNPAPAYSPNPPPAPPADGPANVTMVNTKSIQLDYDIAEVGSSKVKSVEVWYTQDGRSWKKTPNDAKPEPPYVVNVPSEGRYGFTLIARSGVGLGLPTPKMGDQPQVWVEVDTTKPTVNVLGVEVGRGPDMGTLTVRWTANDLHMAASPITISYVDAATGATGQWQPMTPTPIPNDGRFTWRIPEGLPPQILVRVEAVDQAGNVGAADTANPVSTDLSIPKAHNIRVHGAPAESPGAMPPG